MKRKNTQNLENSRGGNLFGFTLLELLLSLSFAVSGSVIFYRAWCHLEKRQSLLVYLHQVINVLYFTQTAAITNQKKVMLCPSVDDRHCDNRWQHDWIVKDTNNKVLSIFASLQPNWCMQWHGNFSFGQKIVYVASGFLNGQRGHFSVYDCLHPIPAVAKIVLLTSGRVRVSST